jgi:hypothetical protein
MVVSDADPHGGPARERVGRAGLEVGLPLADKGGGPLFGRKRCGSAG